MALTAAALVELPGIETGTEIGLSRGDTDTELGPAEVPRPCPLMG
jgi:hypothetical protein